MFTCDYTRQQDRIHGHAWTDYIFSHLADVNIESNLQSLHLTEVVGMTNTITTISSKTVLKKQQLSQHLSHNHFSLRISDVFYCQCIYKPNTFGTGKSSVITNHGHYQNR